MFILILIVVIICLLVIGVWRFFHQPKFGRLPAGDRLNRIKKSSHYKDNRFQNLHFTPQLVEGANLFSVTKKFFFGKSKRTRPPTTLPSSKTDLLSLPTEENCLIWFGHSSYYIQVDRKKILVDPVFSGAASPLAFSVRSFPGSDIYTVEDLPEIDFLFISHDHWDHLDYPTMVRLRHKVKKVITGLGTAAHLEYWGFPKEMILEKDWGEEVSLDQGFIVHMTTARHFSGRTFKRNQSIWTAFVLETPSMKLFLGGDSGYDTHFASIGDLLGPFDLAILECGQYNSYWKYIHMMPEETIQAGLDLKARMILPVHWGKFSLSLHDWDEPIKRARAEALLKGVSLLTPMIGEKINLSHPGQFENWWEKLSAAEYPPTPEKQY
jgi:L-ascorbate metabolism protein UlaG (beta-lactamase superfamily)